MSGMFYWLHVTGGTHLRKYDYDPGPYPKDVAERWRDKIIREHPGLSAGIAPAWEAPFEKMIRVPGQVWHFSSAEKGLRYQFVYKVDADRFYAVSNLRCGTAYRRRTENAFHGAGLPVSTSSHHYIQVTPAGMAHLEAEVKRLTGGKDTWDSGWSPATPAE